MNQYVQWFFTWVLISLWEFFFYSIKIRRPTLCSLAKVDKLLGEFVGKHYKLIA